MKFLSPLVNIFSSFFNFILYIFDSIIKSNMFTSLIAIILTASLTGFFTYYGQKKIEEENFSKNKKKVEQIVNAEILDNLEIANKFIIAKNQIVSDVNLVSFLQDQRFYSESIREILATNFQYINEEDVYHVTIIRDKLNQLNSKLDKLEIKTHGKKLSENPQCNFLYFSPQEKYRAFHFTSDDFNRLIYSIKQLSFFQANPFNDLDEYFQIDKARVSVGWFKYSEEYDKVNINCD